MDAARANRSVRVQGDNAQWFRTTAISAPTAGDFTIAFYARADDAVHGCTLRIYDDTAGSSLDSTTFDVSSTWTKYVFTLDGSGLSGDLTVEWAASADGTSREMELSWPVGIYEGAYDENFVIATGGSLSTVVPKLDRTFVEELNHEGELSIWFKLSEGSPGTTELLELDNGSDTDDTRDLSLDASDDPYFAHYDGSGSSSSGNPAYAASWSAAERQVRARWCRAGVMDDNVSSIQTAEVVAPDGTKGSVRTSAWTPSSVQVDDLRMSGSTNPMDGVVSRVRVSSRELP